MEAVGVAAAGITFSVVILRLSRALYKSAKKIKHARSELMKLIKEMGIFADLYEDFYKTCVSDQRKKGRTTSSTRRLVEWIQHAIDAFSDLLKRVRGIAGDSRLSMRETITAHVKWFFSENEVKYLRSSLSFARESMRGFSNITAIETIDEEILLLRTVIAQENPKVIQALENELGMRLEERLGELKQTSRNRRRQRRAIESRIQEAAEVLEQQSMRTGTRAIVLEPKELIAFKTVVERYAEKVRKQRQRNSDLPVPERQRTDRADSAQPTTSTASSSFASKLSSFTPPVVETFPSSSVEDTESILNLCARCGGTCLRVEEHATATPRSLTPSFAQDTAKRVEEDDLARFRQIPHSGMTSKLLDPLLVTSSSNSPRKIRCTPDPITRRESRRLHTRRTENLRKTHRESRKHFDESNNKIEILQDATAPEKLDSDPDAVSPINEEWHKRNYETPSWDEKGVLDGAEPENEMMSCDEEELHDVSEPEEGFSPFHPVAGVAGKFPPGWQGRHRRSESPQDHWHKRL